MRSGSLSTHSFYRQSRPLCSFGSERYPGFAVQRPDTGFQSHPVTSLTYSSLAQATERDGSNGETTAETFRPIGHSLTLCPLSINLRLRAVCNSYGQFKCMRLAESGAWLLDALSLSLSELGNGASPSYCLHAVDQISFRSLLCCLDRRHLTPKPSQAGMTRPDRDL